MMSLFSAIPATTARRNTPFGVAAAALVGSALEWYDFYLYGTAAALVFNRTFFVVDDPLLATIAAFATFAVGYFVRPLGGLLFGRLGDVLGRKRVLVITLLVMGTATFLMGLVPDHGAIGIGAPILLVLLRLIQGIGAGAEFASAAVFSAENAEPRHRGLHGSWPVAGIYLGLLLASGVFALVTRLPEADFLDWGWRIPFLLSAVVVIVALIIRIRLVESPTFVEVQATEQAQTPVKTVFRSEKTAMLQVVLSQTPQNIVSSVNLAFIAAYVVGTLGLASSVGPLAVTAGTAVTMLVLPFFGWLSDRLGRRPVILGGMIFSGLFAFPYFWIIDTGATQLPITLAVIASLAIGVGAMAGPQAAYFTELFTGNGRLTGLAFSREVAGALTAGTTPLIAVALVAASGGRSWPVALFIVIACVIGVVAVALHGETRGRDLRAASVAELRGSTGSFRG
jgi:MFS family permease